MNNFDKRLIELEKRRQYQAPDHTNWVIEVVEKNEDGDIVVVGRHYYPLIKKGN